MPEKAQRLSPCFVGGNFARFAGPSAFAVSGAHAQPCGHSAYGLVDTGCFPAGYEAVQIALAEDGYTLFMQKYL